MADSTRSHTVSTKAGFDAATAPAVTSSELYQYGDQIEYTCDTGYATNPETKIADTSQLILSYSDTNLWLWWSLVSQSTRLHTYVWLGYLCALAIQILC